MPSELDFIGSLVSINCGELGTYQGRVENIDQEMNTLTISHAFHNGLCCDQPKVSLSSTTILDIKIIYAFHEAQEINTRKATPSKMTRQIDEVTRPACSSPVKIIKATSKTLQTLPESSVHQLNAANEKSGCYIKPSPTSSPSKLSSSGRQSQTSKSINKEPSKKTDNESQQHKKIVELAAGDSIDSSNKKMITTKKKGRGGGKKPNVQNSECFSAPVSSLLQDFDFESNLALFNKTEVFKEIESEGHKRTPDSHSSFRQYRHDENVLRLGDNSTVIRRQQIQVPHQKCQLYYTDTGFVVPSISLELRKRICTIAAQSGLTETRQLEAFARGASEMAIHLIGGCHRIHPKNGHQMPVVVVLCGLHETGAVGACCARMLSAHGIQVVLVVENATNVLPSLSQELYLYKLTGSCLIHDVRELSGTIDLILTSIDSLVNPGYIKEPWSQNVISWMKKSDIRAQVLAIDPSPQNTDIIAKWSLCKVLPLNYMPSASNGSVYFCDLSIPSAIFQMSGITYVSPFGSKFVIPLYEHE